MNPQRGEAQPPRKPGTLLQQPLRASRGYPAPTPALQHISRPLGRAPALCPCVLSLSLSHTCTHTGSYARPLKPQGWSLPRGLASLPIFSPRLWGWSPDLPLSFLPFLIALKPPHMSLSSSYHDKAHMWGSSEDSPDKKQAVFALPPALHTLLFSHHHDTPEHDWAGRLLGVPGLYC